MTVFGDTLMAVLGDTRQRRAVLVAVALLLTIPMATMAAPEPAEASPSQVTGINCYFDQITNQQICEHYTAITQNGQGGIAPVACDPNDGLPCWVERCDPGWHVNDASAFGMVWNGHPERRPTFIAAVHFSANSETDWYVNNIYNTNAPPGPAGTNGATGYYSETGKWWQCTEVDAELDPGVQLFPGNTNGTTWGPVGPLIDVAGIAGQAAQGAYPPVPPVRKSTPDGVASIVQVPTWFWLENTAPVYWTQRSDSASSPTGRMTVTVFADPVETEWATGEGTITGCDEGLPFIPDVTDPDLAGSGVCSWTYGHSTGWNGGPYQVTADATWEMTWQMAFNTGVVADRGPYGPSPVVTVSDGWSIEVEEVLAVASGGG